MQSAQNGNQPFATSSWSFDQLTDAEAAQAMMLASVHFDGMLMSPPPDSTSAIAMSPVEYP